MITEGHGRYFKPDFKFSGGQQSELRFRSIEIGVRDPFVDYLEVCYRHAAKCKSGIHNYVKVRWISCFARNLRELNGGGVFTFCHAMLKA